MPVLSVSSYALPFLSNLDQQFRGRFLEQHFYHLYDVDLHGACLDPADRVAHRFGETHARQEFVHAERTIHTQARGFLRGGYIGGGFLSAGPGGGERGGGGGGPGPGGGGG